MEVSDHGLERPHRLQRRVHHGVADIRSEVRQCVVPPVVRETAIHQVVVFHVVVYRHQFDCGDAQILHVADGALRCQGAVGSTNIFWKLSEQFGESFDMHFVNHRLMPRDERRPVIAPGERVVYDCRQGSELRVVAAVHRQVCILSVLLVAIHLRRPSHGACNGFGVGIEHNLVGIETVPGKWIVGSMHAVAVHLPGQNPRQVSVPDHIRLFGQGVARRFRWGISRIKQAQFHLGGVLGENGEVYSRTIPCGPERVGHSRSHFHDCVAEQYFSPGPSWKSVCTLKRIPELVLSSSRL